MFKIKVYALLTDSVSESEFATYSTSVEFDSEEKLQKELKKVIQATYRNNKSYVDNNNTTIEIADSNDVRLATYLPFRKETMFLFKYGSYVKYLEK